MANELKQLTQRIKNSADKRYALKDEANVVQNVTISYEGGGAVGGSSGEGSGIVVNPRAIVVQDGITERRIEELIQAHIDAIPNSQKENSIVYKWNETVPATRGIFTKINEIDTGLRNGVISYADKKGWLFVASTDGGNTKVFDLNNNYNQIMSLPDILWSAIVTPDAKRLVTIRNSNLHIADIYKLKDDESGYELENSIDIGDNIRELALDGLGTTLVAVRLHLVYIYELNEQGSWNKIKDYFIEQSDGCEISKDGNVILVEGQNYPEKIYEIRKENEIWGEPEEVITSPAPVSGFGYTKFELTLDKQVLYIGNHQDNAVANDAGRVYVFYNGIDPNSTDPFSDGSLKHFWKLNGDSIDSITNIAGNIVGNISYEPAKFDLGAKFENGENRIDTTLSTPVFKDGAPATIAFWYKDIDGGNTHHRILGKRDLNEGCTFEIYCNNGNTLSFAYLNGSTWTDLGFSYTEEMTSEFKYVVFSYDGTNMSMYINGELKETHSAQFSGINQTSNTFNIGAINNDSNYYPHGIIDHIQVFDRSLTQGEITQLYSGGWYLKHTINPPTNNTNQKFGAGIASNFDNSRVWIASMGTHKVYEYQVGDTAILNENDPFGDGSLKHFWKLDGNLDDSVSGLTPVVYNNPSFDNNTLRITTDNGFRVDKPFNLSSESYTFIAKFKVIGDASKHNGDNNTRNYLFNFGGYWEDNGLAVGSYNNRKYRVANHRTSNESFESNMSEIQNEWINAVLICDKTNVKLYINNTLIVDTNMNLVDTTHFALMSVYQKESDNSNTKIWMYMGDGYIDHIQIFDRVLTDDEVTQLYNAEG
jgi:hypothetical protein